MLSGEILSEEGDTPKQVFFSFFPRGEDDKVHTTAVAVIFIIIINNKSLSLSLVLSLSLLSKYEGRKELKKKSDTASS